MASILDDFEAVMRDTQWDDADLIEVRDVSDLHHNTATNMSRSERLQHMIDECLGGQRPKKLIPELRRELTEQLAVERQEGNEREIEHLKDTLRTTRDRLDKVTEARDSYQSKWMDCKTPRPVFGDAAGFGLGVVISALITSFVWACVVLA